MTWRERAACLGVDPDLFFPRFSKSPQRRLALEICGKCEVTTPCLDYALKMGTAADFGIWGGTSANQRDKLRDRQKTPTASR